MAALTIQPIEPIWTCREATVPEVLCAPTGKCLGALKIELITAHSVIFMEQETLVEPAPIVGNGALHLLAQLGKVVAYEMPSPSDSKARRMQRALKNAGVLMSCTAAFYWVWLYPNIAMDRVYNHVLFHPNVEAPKTLSIAGMPIEKVSFKSQNGARLHGWFVQNPHAKKVILFSHGNGGNLDSFVPTVEAAVRAGASVLAYDYQGFGQSEGKPTLDGIIEDGQAAYDYLVKVKNVARDRIVFFGQSMGTGVSCQLLKTRSAAAVVLMSPYTNIVSVAREHLAWLNLYPDFAFPKQDLNTQKMLCEVHPRTLIIHGEQDQTVPVHHSRALAATCIQPTEVLFVDRAGHNDLMAVAPEKIIEAIRRYVD